MIQHTNHSQAAQLLDQIEAEYIAAQRGLTGFAESAKHAAINARLHNIGHIHHHLHNMLGDEAHKLVAQRLETVPDVVEDVTYASGMLLNVTECYGMNGSVTECYGMNGSVTECYGNDMGTLAKR